ncbi:MAG TPA: efflux RND transporter periplasmic adaptor subunit [Gemmatimonadales bacterium]|nr:efflux RND transporter periplasmic adaptor subunit [Gemmatimonadales bacterium]
MSRRTKLGLLVTLVVVVVGGIFALAAAKKNNNVVDVRMEKVARRDLVAAVTSSGHIEAKTSVDVTADITGRIIQIGVKEGDLVKKGQFILQIDPTQYQAAVSQARALLSSSQASQVQASANRDQAQRSLQRAQELKKSGNALISTEQVEQAQTAYDVAVANYNSAQAQVAQNRANVDRAESDLNRSRIFAPIDGRVTRLPVEVGEVAVPATFSKDNALLATVADLGTILANVQVDETDVVRLAIGDSVVVSIDAFPDTTFTGRVTKISNSAVLTSGAITNGTADKAVDFQVEVTLDHPPADIRPDLSCTARIVTDVRKQALSIPIIALTVRQHTALPNEQRAARPEQGAKAPSDTAAIKPKDTEGVFVVDNGVATFHPVKVGIAGDEYFEVLTGLTEGQTIVAGTYQAIRDLKDSSRVRASLPMAMAGPSK